MRPPLSGGDGHSYHFQLSPGGPVEVLVQKGGLDDQSAAKNGSRLGGLDYTPGAGCE